MPSAALSAGAWAPISHFDSISVLPSFVTVKKLPHANNINVQSAVAQRAVKQLGISSQPHLENSAVGSLPHLVLHSDQPRRIRPPSTHTIGLPQGLRRCCRERCPHRQPGPSCRPRAWHCGNRCHAMRGRSPAEGRIHTAGSLKFLYKALHKAEEPPTV
jgi:hypothetical protein